MFSRLYHWVEERVEFQASLRVLLDRKIPAGVGWLYALGSASLLLFFLQVITGALLALSYSPSPLHAYDSVQYINEQVLFGNILRGIHKWGASGMMVVLFLHGLRVYFMAAYKYPRELTWVVGVLLFLLVLTSAFTGYLLPWDQRAYWATVVGTNIAGAVPYVGDFLRTALRGGNEVGAVTLARFYGLHIGIVPALIAGLVGIHLYLVLKQGISAPPEKER